MGREKFILAVAARRRERVRMDLTVEIDDESSRYVSYRTSLCGGGMILRPGESLLLKHDGHQFTVQHIPTAENEAHSAKEDA